MNNRVAKALSVLKEYKKGSYTYLGEGYEGVIFHDERYVYKVFIPKGGGPEDIDDFKFAFLKSKSGKFKNKKHLIDYEFLTSKNNIKMIKYKFEEFEKVREINEEEAISFLTECWQEKIVFRDVKLSNFIRIDGILKYIDYGFNGDFAPYNDNFLENMAARMFIDIKYPYLEEDRKSILKRSTTNNFTLPELEGFKEFLNKLFSNIIFEETRSATDRYKMPARVKKTYSSTSPDRLVDSIHKDMTDKDELTIFVKNFERLNFEQLFWKLLKHNIRIEKIRPYDIRPDGDGYHRPEGYILKVWKLKPLDKKVSLVIKTCPQDSKTLYQQVKHILKQMLAPNNFYEKIIAIDKKESDFLRQYTDNGNLEELYGVISRLIDEGLIDSYIELPDEEIEEVNQRWFGIRTFNTHTVTNIPVTPQVYAFEEVHGDYILQMDSDVLIGREDYSHSFLKDMVKALDMDENAISVGFNIPKAKEIRFVGYHAPPGEYKPEVRLGLIHKKRLLNLRPLPNESVEGKLKLGWYQSLHQLQKRTKYVSLRGGDRRSYYIHPQNYRKTCIDQWFTVLDRVESDIIPDIQREHFDLEGSYYDWTIPKREEPLVIVTLLRNVGYSRFIRMWNSVVSQQFKDFGWIIIDDDSDNGIGLLIENLIDMFGLKQKITFIKNRFRQGIASNTYKAIHYFVNNPDSIIVIVDGDDALIGKNVLYLLYKKYFYFNNDVVIGKMYRTDKLWSHYPYMPNFYNPRLYGGSVWQHIRSFKKYLFDSIELVDLKMSWTEETVCKLSKVGWIEYCVDFAYMIPIVEMSQNPGFVEIYTYYHERTTPNKKEIRKLKDSIIDMILSREPYSPKMAIKRGRKDFMPNLNKIEIDITYDCNLKCKSCNRSCSQAPSKEDYMSLGQIKKFISESIELNKKWELINILGGEPTLHPNFVEIVQLIYDEYILKHSTNTVLQITSNGYSEKTREILEKLPKSKNIVIDRDSFKQSPKVEYFTQFNVAPVDLQEYRTSDFSKACWVTSYCGIGLNKYGYYPCGVAGAMDRVMGYDIGIKSLKEVTVDKLKELLDVFCRYCGNFVDYSDNFGDFIPRCEKRPFKKPIITKTWVEIYLNYHRKRPKLTPIYER